MYVYVYIIYVYIIKKKNNVHNLKMCITQHIIYMYDICMCVDVYVYVLYTRVCV